MSIRASESGGGRRRGSRVVVGSVAAYVGVLALLSSCVVTPPRAGSVGVDERLDAFPTSGLDLRGEVELMWDGHMIPTIVASEDRDASYALGLVHAHLRLAQMEMLRRISQGRISEMAGPLTHRFDHMIRALDLDRAVPEMSEGLPAETRAWIEAYVAGINDYVSLTEGRSADYRTLGFDEGEAWTVEDVLTVGRLASVDINWGRWVGVLPLRDEAGYGAYIARLESYAGRGAASFGAGPGVETELDVLLDRGRVGSNCVAVSGDRTASGSAMIASDPHLGLSQPNLWCVVTVRSPGGVMSGLSFPGLPFVLVGRSERTAWGGTNMQSLSSILYDLRGKSEAITGEREERLGTRWWFDKTVTIRESAYGPVITDASLFADAAPGPAAMRWRGHAPSDEASAFLRAGRAADWAGFRAAFRTFAAGGQNMLFADAEGNIGQVAAVEAIPAAGRAAFAGAVDPEDPLYAWNGGIPSTALPAAFNPSSGYLVSANNTPVALEPGLVAQGNADDRILRMRELIEGVDVVTVDVLRGLQRDTHSVAGASAAVAIAAAMSGADLDADARALLDAVSGWDGDYAADSKGALAYQALMSALVDRGYAGRYGPGLVRLLKRTAYVHSWVAEDVEAGRIGAGVIGEALTAAAAGWDGDGVWGDVHRIRLSHPIGNVPLLGRGYRFGEFGVGGSLSTVQKTASGLTAEPHSVGFGANARHIADLSDADANWVVLLGGQDGWLGSAAFVDQVPLWRSGEMIRVPLREGSARAGAVRVMRLGGGS